MIEAENIINTFSLFSGLRRNAKKTKVMKLGSRKNEREEASLPFKIVERIKILGIVFENGETAKNLEQNWTGRIENIKRIIQLWSKRDLSVKGKIVIVKCFLASQLIFIMQSIGIPEKVLTYLNRLFYKFIWQKRFSNRKAFEKVKRSVMEGNVDEGGLNMVNIVHLQKAFYLQWVGKLSDSSEEKWTYIPRWFFSKLANGLGVFNFNCRSKYVKGIDKIGNVFWKTVLSTYLDNKKLITEEDIDEENFHQQILWNNTLIQYKQNVLFFPDWKRHGIEYMIDIIKDNEKRLFTVEEIKQKIGCRGSIVLDFNAVINAIPRTWSDRIVNIQTTNLEIERLTVRKLHQYLKKPKDLMKLIANRDKLKPCCTGFWQRRMHISITDWHWKVAVKCTKETRLQVLHWKILHNIYPTNILLNRLGIVESKYCKYCKNEIDYIEHFFWYCDSINTIWKRVEEYVGLKCNTTIKLKLTDALLGYSGLENNSEVQLVINHVILIAKTCISKF